MSNCHPLKVVGRGGIINKIHPPQRRNIVEGEILIPAVERNSFNLVKYMYIYFNSLRVTWQNVA